MKSKFVASAVLATLLSGSLARAEGPPPVWTLDGQANFDVKASSLEDYENHLRVQDAEIKFQLLVREGIKVVIKTELEQRLDPKLRQKDFDFQKVIEEAYIQIETDKVSGLPRAGLKSYIYCGVTKSDPRAQAAYNWLRGHYTVTENPGMGTNSLYYYYHTMAKTLDVYGQKIVTDKNGKPHDWAQELSAHLISEQHPDGSWFNTNARHWENQPGLVTSYTLIALSYCVKK